MNDLGYRITLALLYALALLPMRVLYVLSDFLYLIVYHVARYRRKLVRENLAACFPDKNETDRRDIEKKFYRNFTDYIVETVKLLHISDAEIKRRMQFENIELIDRLTAEGRSVVIYFSHCGNWEWATSMTLHVRHDADSHVEYCQVYRPLRSEITDRLMLRLRSRFGSLSFPKSSVLRDLIKLRRNGVTSVTGFMSDQKPSHGDPTVVTTLLNRPTAMISGTETLARKLDMAVIYWDMEKPGRGRYRLTCRLICENPAEMPGHSITLSYAAMLQETIERNPSIWLWTHNRWKYPVQLPS
jgi:Lauroyl/myristoyl acyltransferase